MRARDISRMTTIIGRWRAVKKRRKQETTRFFARRQLPVGSLEVRSPDAYRTRISDVYLGWHGYAAGVSKGIGGGGAGGGRLCGRTECGGWRCGGESSGGSNSVWSSEAAGFGAVAAI